MVDKVLDKIKEIKGIKKFDDTEILIKADDKLSDDIILKRVVTLMTSVIKGGNKFYPQLFLDHALYDEQMLHKSCEKDISKELLPVAWRPTGWWHLCLPELDKKGMEPIFVDKVGKWSK